MAIRMGNLEMRLLRAVSVGWWGECWLEWTEEKMWPDKEVSVGKQCREIDR